VTGVGHDGGNCLRKAILVKMKAANTTAQQLVCQITGGVFTGHRWPECERSETRRSDQSF
jgi:hypothetical protein